MSKGSKRRPEASQGLFESGWDRVFSRSQLDENGVDWSLPELWAADCPLCDCCGEPFCEECGEHYADCKHPGPDSERIEVLGNETTH